LLEDMLGRVRTDLATRPHDRPRLVFLGDYVDRGPDSRGVIETLLAVEAGPLTADFLLGNHDALALAFLEDPEDDTGRLHWLYSGMGGMATLRSYGVDAAIEEAGLDRLHATFAEAFPAAHRDFLRRCRRALPIGGYLFVHAGIRPGVPHEAQDPEDLIWIREPFLSSAADFGAKIVHGHTIVPYVEHHPNRIALDTGAVRTGVLSCVVLEGRSVALLEPEGPRRLAEGAGLGLDRLGRQVAERLGRLWPARRRAHVAG
jgi:serine/threonine protein phosphatase 1